MYFGMVLEMRRLTEGRLASVAFVGFFAGMYPPVIPERSVTGEAFVANLTNVGLFAAVGSFVIFQMRRLGELHAAYIAPGDKTHY